MNNDITQDQETQPVTKVPTDTVYSNITDDVDEALDESKYSTEVTALLNEYSEPIEATGTQLLTLLAIGDLIINSSGMALPVTDSVALETILALISNPKDPTVLTDTYLVLKAKGEAPE